MIRGVLIGNPVDRSISHRTHNEIFQKSGVNGIYEKRAICVERLSREVWDLKRENYAFLAVTMPLKELIVPFLDEVREEIGSVNTIEVRDKRWIGHNFDGVGCLNAIERVERVLGARVLVLGAGGAARAAIYEAKQRGANVFVYNRTYERAERVALQFGVSALKEITEAFDVIIQATSAGMFGRELPMDITWLCRETLVMEMIYNPMQTPFVEEALRKGCRIVWGYEMFAELSFLQLALVNQEKIDKELVFQVVRKFFVKN